MYLCGIDVGGTKLEIVCIQVDPPLSKNDQIQAIIGNQRITYTQLSKKRIMCNRLAGLSVWIEQLKLCLTSVLEQAKIEIRDLHGIGIGLPGSVDPSTDRMVNGNSRMLIGEDIGKIFRDHWNFKGIIRCFNDANCFAFAEAVAGVGLAHTVSNNISPADFSLCAIILGTGVGGGFYWGGRILAGKAGGGGELGHLTLHEHGHPCYCGKQGCSEQYLSGPGLEAAMNVRLYSQINERPQAEQIFALQRSGDPIACAVIGKYKRDLALFLANLTNIFDPHLFVLGGGVSKQQEIYEGLSEKMADLIFLKKTPPAIYQHQLGDSAGVIGAALQLLAYL